MKKLWKTSVLAVSAVLCALAALCVPGVAAGASEGTGLAYENKKAAARR